MKLGPTPGISRLDYSNIGHILKWCLMLYLCTNNCLTQLFAVCTRDKGTLVMCRIFFSFMTNLNNIVNKNMVMLQSRLKSQLQRKLSLMLRCKGNKSIEVITL